MLQARYIETGHGRLFSVLHPAAEGLRRGVAVLMCYPGPQEYMTTHWAFRRLAQRLCRAGFPVLRFDYAGTGDSEGDRDVGTCGVWQRNIRDAAAALRSMSGVQDVAVIGFRLGAALAAQACAEGLSVSDLVLWDPVVSGDGYVRSLRGMQAYAWSRMLRPPRAGQDEVLGEPLTQSMCEQLGALDLRKASPTGARHVHLVTSTDDAAYSELEASYGVAGVRSSRHTVSEEARGGESGGVLLSPAVVNAIAEVLQRRAA